MSLDRFIKWGPPPEWGPPTQEKLAQVARDFLGPRWHVTTRSPWWLLCLCDDPQTFALASERPEIAAGIVEHINRRGPRGFEIYFVPQDQEGTSSVITREADEFTGALADCYAEIIARWWNGTVCDP